MDFFKRFPQAFLVIASFFELLIVAFVLVTKELGLPCLSDLVCTWGVVFDLHYPGKCLVVPCKIASHCHMWDFLRSMCIPICLRRIYLPFNSRNDIMIYFLKKCIGKYFRNLLIVLMFGFQFTANPGPDTPSALKGNVFIVDA